MLIEHFPMTKSTECGKLIPHALFEQLGKLLHGHRPYAKQKYPTSEVIAVLHPACSWQICLASMLFADGALSD